jgi:hypothetical protein
MTLPLTAEETALLDKPHDTCFKCGRPTPLGVSLCDRDNPGKIKSPSSTQVHGTILVGVLGGFVALLLIFRLVSAGVGPFASSVSGVATRADGGLDVVVSVTNGGTKASGASCSVSVGGAPTYTDYVFFTEPIPAGASQQFERSLPAPTNGSSLPAANVLVRCN